MTLRREIALPEEDVEHLDARGLPWETIRDGGQVVLLLHDFPIPQGYNHSVATAALMIPPQYPFEQLDMVWVYPILQRTDGVQIGALSQQMYTVR